MKYGNIKDAQLSPFTLVLFNWHVYKYTSVYQYNYFSIDTAGTALKLIKFMYACKIYQILSINQITGD